MPTNIGPCPCPQIQLAVNAVDQNTVNVVVAAGGPVTVTLGTVLGTTYTQRGDGPFLFGGLEPNTVYSVVAHNDCGNTSASPVRTVACPAIVLAQDSNTVDSVTISVAAGGPVQLTLGTQEATVATGGTHTFTGLAAGTGYTVRAVSACESTAVLTAQTAACPDITIVQVAATTTPTAVAVQVTAGGPVTLTLGTAQAVVAQGGTHVFTGLSSSTDYTVNAASACGKTAILTARTLDCPPLVLNGSAFNSSTIRVIVASGGPADLTVNGQTAFGVIATHDFTGLPTDTTYTVTGVSSCGNRASTTVTLACGPVELTATLQGANVLVTVLQTSGATRLVGSNGQIFPSVIQGGTALFTPVAPNGFFTVTGTNECGRTGSTSIYVPDVPANPVYCPSQLLDSGRCGVTCAMGLESGYAYRDNALRDPLATVLLPSCAGQESYYGYPAAGMYPDANTVGAVRAEVPYYNGGNTIIAYLANRSDCNPE